MLLTNTEDFEVDLQKHVYYVRYAKGSFNPEVVQVRVATKTDDYVVVINKEKHRIIVFNKDIPYRLWHNVKDAEKALEAMKKKDNWTRRSFTVDAED